MKSIMLQFIDFNVASFFGVLLQVECEVGEIASVRIFIYNIVTYDAIYF